MNKIKLKILLSTLVSLCTILSMQGMGLLSLKNLVVKIHMSRLMRLMSSSFCRNCGVNNGEVEDLKARVYIHDFLGIPKSASAYDVYTSYTKFVEKNNPEFIDNEVKLGKISEEWGKELKGRFKRVSEAYDAYMGP